MKESMKKEISLQLKRVVALFVMGSVAVASAFSVAALSKRVCIVDTGSDLVKNFVTLSTDTDKILQQADIVLSEDDKVIRDDSNKECINIVVDRAFEVKVIDGEFTRTAITTSIYVCDLISNLGISLGEKDETSPSLDSIITPGTDLHIIRRCSITLTINGETKDVLVPIGNVIDALKYLGIDLNDEDELSVDKDSNTYEGMHLNVDKVEYREVESTEEVNFGIVTYLSDDMYEGESVITREGINGEKQVVTRQKLVNGQVVDSQVISENITKQPQSQIKTIGTKRSGNCISCGYARDNRNGTLVDHYGNTISYTSVLSGIGSAYTAPAGAHTSTGRLAQFGNVAVNPNVIPYGTRLYICSSDGSYVYGYAIAADTGGAMLSGSRLVDLYYNTTSECLQFGVRNVNVYIIG